MTAYYLAHETDIYTDLQVLPEGSKCIRAGKRIKIPFMGIFEEKEREKQNEVNLSKHTNIGILMFSLPISAVLFTLRSIFEACSYFIILNLLRRIANTVLRSQE
jgi:hypothetical protein